MRLAALLFVALLLTVSPAMAERPISRGELLKIVEQYTDLKARDFEEYGLRDGRSAFGAKKPEKGTMITFIGPKDNVSEVVVMAGASEKTIFRLEFMMSTLAIVTADWNDATKWVTQSIADVAKANGGHRNTKVNGWRIEVGYMPPNIMMLNSRRE